MNEDLLNRLVEAADTHSIVMLGDDLIADTDIQDWIDGATAEQKLCAVIDYLEGTV